MKHRTTFLLLRAVAGMSSGCGDGRDPLISILIDSKGSNRTMTGSVRTYIVGDNLPERTPSGLWPSDHAGVVAQLQIP